MSITAPSQAVRARPKAIAASQWPAASQSPAPGQVAQHRQCGRGEHLGVADRGQRGQRAIGQRVAQAVHQFEQPQVQRQRLAMTHHQRQEAEQHPGQHQQDRRQQGKRDGFPAVGVEDGHRMPAQHRMRTRPGQRAGQQRIGMGGEPAIAVQHHRPDQRQHQQQQCQHDQQAPGHRGHRVIGLAQRPARQQEQHRPGQGRCGAGRQIAPQRHVQHPGHGRHERPDRPDVAGHEDGLDAVAPEQPLAALQQLRITAEGPVPAQLAAPAPADPEAHPVTDEGPQRRAGDCVGAGQLAQADQHTHADQQRQRRHDRPDQDQRVGQCDQEHHRAGGNRMGGEPVQQAIEPGIHRRHYRNRRLSGR